MDPAKGLVGDLGGDLIIQDCIENFDPAALNCNSSPYSSLVRTRVATVANVGLITVMDTAFNQIQNYFDQNTNGVDLEAKLRIPQTGFGDLTFTYNATYIFQQEQKVTFIPGEQWSRRWDVRDLRTGAALSPLPRRYVAKRAVDRHARQQLLERLRRRGAERRWVGPSRGFLGHMGPLHALDRHQEPCAGGGHHEPVQQHAAYHQPAAKFQLGYEASRCQPVGPGLLPDRAVQVSLERTPPPRDRCACSAVARRVRLN